MPRLARLDAPGALHHIIIRGLNAKRYLTTNPIRKIRNLGSTSAEAMADLPMDLTQRLNTAAKGAMSKQLLDLLEQIPPDLRHVADALADLVSQYQFSKIIALTKKENKYD